MNLEIRSYSSPASQREGGLEGQAFLIGLANTVVLPSWKVPLALDEVVDDGGRLMGWNCGRVPSKVLKKINETSSKQFQTTGVVDMNSPCSSWFPIEREREGRVLERSETMGAPSSLFSDPIRQPHASITKVASPALCPMGTFFRGSLED